MHTISTHPLIQHRLVELRNPATPPKRFRILVRELSTFLGYEALRELPTRAVPAPSPFAVAEGREIAATVVLVPILRAGLGMLDALSGLLPDASVGVLGMQRNEKTAEPEPYYAKVPVPAGEESLAILLDPMLATGGSACDAIATLKKLGYKRILFLCLISCPEGLSRLEKEHPDVPVWAAAEDDRLNEVKYIVPGIGDAGDRLFGTL